MTAHVPLTFTRPAAPLPLQDHERELIEGEIQALIEVMPGDRGARYRALADAMADGVVPGEAVETFQEVLELLLASGRARHVHRADGERLLEAVYDRTPRGKAARAELASTNQALRALAGQSIDSVRVTSSVTGRRTLSIATEALQVTLVIDRHGLRLDKVGV